MTTHIPEDGSNDQLIERIERLEKEKSEIGVNIREVYAEAKLRFDPKAMREMMVEQ